jgi:hypothetical protein
MTCRVLVRVCGGTVKVLLKSRSLLDNSLGFGGLASIAISASDLLGARRLHESVSICVTDNVLLR